MGRRKDWTAADLAALRRLRSATPPTPYRECAVRLGRTYHSCEKAAVDYGIARRQTPQEVIRAAIVRYKPAGWSDARIAAAVGNTSETAVRQCRHRMGRRADKVGNAEVGRRRSRNFAEKARDRGWPVADPSGVRTLAAVEAAGRLTPPELAARVGRAVKTCRDDLARLARGGHLAVVGRVGRFREHRVYALSEATRDLRAVMGHDVRPTPPKPTSFPPGHPEKVKVLKARDDDGYGLWHPGDYSPDLNTNVVRFLDCLAEFAAGESEGDHDPTESYTGV